MHNYTEAEREDTIPVGIAAKLEKYTGIFPVMRHMALTAGHDIVKLPPLNARRLRLDHLGKIIKEFSDVLEKASSSLKSGDLDRKEVGELLKEIDEHLSVLIDLWAAVEERRGQKLKAVA